MIHPVAYARSARLAQTAVPTGGIDPRLKPAAHAFEASLIQELLKPMQHDPLFSDSSAESGAGGLAGGLGGGGMDTMSSLGTQALAQAIADRGGLGIATEVLKKVQAEKAGTATVPESGKDRENSKELLHGLRESQSHLEPWAGGRHRP
jgi:Rod binding domain-containing protein